MHSDLIAQGVLAGIMFAVFCHSLHAKNYGAAVLSGAIVFAMLTA